MKQARMFVGLVGLMVAAPAYAETWTNLGPVDESKPMVSLLGDPTYVLRSVTDSQHGWIAVFQFDCSGGLCRKDIPRVYFCFEHDKGCRPVIAPNKPY